MTEDEKKAVPIVGALMPIKSKEAEVKAEAIVDDDDDDDLPFKKNKAGGILPFGFC